MKYKKYLAFFLGLYLALSLLVYVFVPATNAHLDNDSADYERLGLRFVNTKTFANDNQDMPHHTNGYPLFLALIYSFFGYSRAIVILIQILLGLLSGFLIFSIAHKLFNPTVALISFILFSFNLGFLIFPQFILSETLLVFLLLFSSERLIDFAKRKSLFSLVFSGLLLGVSIAVKPVALYYVLLLVPIIFFSQNNFFKTKLKFILLFLLSFYIPVMGYMFANKTWYGDFCVNPLAQANIYVWFHAKIKATQNNTTHNQEMEKLPPLTSEKIKQDFFELVKKNKILAIKVWFREVFKSFFGLFTTNLKVLLEPDIRGGDISFFASKQKNIFARISDYITAGTDSITIKIIGFLEIFYNFFRYILILIALFVLYKKREFFILAYFSSYVFYFSMITGHDGCARYRIMFEGIFLILAGLAITLLFQAVPHSLRRRGTLRDTPLR